MMLIQEGAYDFLNFAQQIYWSFFHDSYGYVWNRFDIVDLFGGEGGGNRSLVNYNASFILLFIAPNATRLLI